MGVQSDNGLLMLVQVDFEVFGHVQGKCARGRKSSQKIIENLCFFTTKKSFSIGDFFVNYLYNN